jgi:hypothetical protein
MKTILLHIGRHKSGTSSIQRFLFNNAGKLNSLGFHYSLKNIESGFAHHEFAKKLQKQFHKEFTIEQSLYELKNSLRIFKDNFGNNNIEIVSSEAFQNCEPLLIKECFKEFNVHVCFYLRNEIDYLLSSYLQKVHATNYSESLEHYSENFKVNYKSFVDNWKSVFSNVEFRVFDRKMLVEGDVVSDFISNFLKLNNFSELALIKEDVNPSLTYRYYALKLYLNKYWHIDEVKHKKLYKKLGELSALDAKLGGEKFKLSQLAINKMMESGSLSAIDWQNETFGKEVFNYDYLGQKNTKLSEIQIEQALSELETYWGVKIEDIGQIREPS